MKEWEQNVMCVLLHSLMDKKLITQDIHDQARAKILDTWDGPGWFFSCEDNQKEAGYGHTQNSL